MHAPSTFMRLMNEVPFKQWGKFRTGLSLDFRSEEDLNRHLREFLDEVVCQLGKE